MSSDIVRAQIMPLDITQTKAAMTMHQEQLREIVAASDWQEFRDRKTGETRRFLKRSGWRKIAFWYALDLEIIREELDRDEQGRVIRAHVIARARHPNGRYADGDGGCSASERGFSKPEHDIAAVAVTRATNRAISNLVGAGDLSAEELDGTGDTSEAAQPWGPVASDEQEQQAANLVRAIAGPGVTVNGEKFILAMGQRFDGVPEACVTMLRGLARFLGDARAAQTPPPEDAPPEPEQSAYHDERRQGP